MSEASDHIDEKKRSTRSKVVDPKKIREVHHDKRGVK